MATVERLTKFNVFNSRDLRESEAVVSRTMCPHVLAVRSDDGLHLVQNKVALERSELFYLHYGIPVEVVNAGIEDHYLFMIPQHGRSAVTIQGVSVPGGVGRGVIIPAGQVFHINSNAAACSFVWRIRRRALEDCARQLTGEDFSNVIAFEPGVLLNEGATAGIGRAMDYMISELEQDDNLFKSTHALERFEQSLMHALIALQPSNLNEGKGRSAIAPRCVRRVEDYIMANAGEQILLSDLITVSGVCGRTLFRTFRQFRDVSPMEYLRRTRLRMVRQSLMQSGGSETVTSVLTKWGVTQFGRFAADYRRQYGELPSETLRAGRGGYGFSSR